MDNSNKTILAIQQIPLDADPKELVDLFGIAGPITQAHIARHPTSLQSLGYGFVKYSNPEDAKRALNLNYKKMRNNTLLVTYYTDSTPFSSPPTNYSTSAQNQGMQDMSSYALNNTGKDSSNLFSSAQHIMSTIAPPNNLTNSNSVPAKVFLENIPVTLKEIHIREKFGKFGQILEVKILLDGAGLSKGIGFIKYDSLESAARAATEMNGFRCENGYMPLKCKLSGSSDSDVKPRKSRFSDNTDAQTARLARFSDNTSNTLIQRTITNQAMNRFDPYGKPTQSQQENNYSGQQYSAPNNQPIFTGYNNHYMNSQGNQFNNQFNSQQSPNQMYSQINMQQNQGQQGHGNNPMNLGQNNVSINRSIYVGNLPETSCKNCLLYQLFSPYGAVESVKGLDGKVNDHKTWFGFVNYKDAGAAERAVDMLDKSSLDGATLKVQLKAPRNFRDKPLRA